jgi:hypothetical protein
MQRKQEKELEDLTVETKQASAVKGGIVPEAPERTVVDPNMRTVIDPNVRTIVDPNFRN